MGKSTLRKLAIIGGSLPLLLLGSCNGDEDTTREEFILCKLENLEATAQYNYCINALRYEHWYETYGNEGNGQATAGAPTTTDGQDPGGMVTDQQPGGMVVDQQPGGMVTDQQPGGMVTDQQTGEFIGFDPAPETLDQCAILNVKYRDAVKSCGDALKKCVAGNGCDYPPAPNAGN